MKLARLDIITIGLAAGLLLCSLFSFDVFSGHLSINPSDAAPEGVRGYQLSLKAAAESRDRVLPAGDVPEAPTRSTLRLYIDGEEVGPAHFDHQSIRERGTGQFSHWSDGLIFSLPPNVSAIDEVRRIEVVWPLMPFGDVFRLLAIAFSCALLATTPLLLRRYMRIPTKPTIAVGCAAVGLAGIALALLPLESSHQISPEFASSEGALGYRLPLGPLQGANDLGFPQSDDSSHPTRSTLRLYVNGVEASPAHSDHAAILAGSGGYSHWGNSVLFSTPGNLRGDLSALEVRWALVPYKELSGALGGVLLVVSALLLAPPQVLSPLFTLIVRRLSSRKVAANAAWLLAAGGCVEMLLLSPGTPIFQLDSTTWLGGLPIVPPYYSWIYGAFDAIARLFGAQPFQSVVVLNAMIFFGALGFLGFAVAKRTPVSWMGPLLVLLIIGADSVTVYVLFALSEAPAIAVMFAALACLIMAGNDRFKWAMLGAVIVVGGAAFRPALAFLIPLFVFALVMARPSRMFLTRAAISFVVASILFNVAFPILIGRPNSSQLGISLYANVYWLVPQGQSSPTENATPVATALSEAVEPFRVERAKQVGSEALYTFDTNEYVRIALASMAAAQVNGVSADKVSDALTEAGVAIVQKYPVDYAVHVLDHTYAAMNQSAGLWKFPWYGKPLLSTYAATNDAAQN
ncbi:MAG TPA: hypothetical protein VF447_17175, partial [Terriglobales bacterium]